MINPYLQQTAFWSRFFLQTNRNDSRHKIHIFESGYFEAIVYQYPLIGNKVFWYIPRAFAVKNSLDENDSDYIEEVKNLLGKIEQKAKEQGNVVYLKLDFNQLSIFDGVATFLSLNGYTKSERKVQYLKTKILVFDEYFNIEGINQGDYSIHNIIKFWDQNQELFQKYMDKRTRYGVRKALQYPWKIKVEKTDFAIESFLKLHLETASRQKFYTFPKNYFDELFNLEESVLINLLDQENIPHASWLGINLNSTLYHLFGANDLVSRDNYGQYLLHLIVFYLTIEKHIIYYDLGGLEEDSQKGYNLFKKGFIGEDINFYGPYDKVFKPFWYKLYLSYRKFRKMF
jgi:lipid II:glycine glycyltransferase (peptidoglycan interpeptide bridge formation enzyme)